MRDKPIKAGPEAGHTLPEDPTDDYFTAAFRALSEDRTSRPFSMLFRRQHIMSSCVFSFLTLESAINRTYYDTFARTDQTRKQIKPGIPTPLATHIKNRWDQFSIRDKYLLMPPLISEFQFSLDEAPFNLFLEFIQFRNRLVHPKMFEVASMEHGDTAPNARSVFPLTGFATSFNSLSLQDAEKAFEIAYRMRRKLATATATAEPMLMYESSPGNFTPKRVDEIASLITLRFGPLEPLH